jgi:hypothetical protein
MAALICGCLFVLGASSQAYAAGELLWNGGAISGSLSLVITAEQLLIEDMGAAFKPDILCSVLFTGETVTNGTNFQITQVLDLAEKSPMSCVDDAGVCTNPVSVTAGNLPWAVKVEKVGAIYHFVVARFRFTVVCTTVIGKIEDTCEVKGEDETAENLVEGLLSEITEAEATEDPGECTQGGAKQGLIEGDVSVYTDPAGGVLTVSN